MGLAGGFDEADDGQTTTMPSATAIVVSDVTPKVVPTAQVLPSGAKVLGGAEFAQMTAIEFETWLREEAGLSEERIAEALKTFPQEQATAIAWQSRFATPVPREWTVEELAACDARERDDSDLMQMLLLADLSLDGTIPAALGELRELRRIDLDGNSLTGEIPSELGDLSNLDHLYLDGNSLTGSIPEALGKLDKLVQLVLNRNQLSGSVPAALGDMDSLRELWLRDNQLTGRIPLRLGRLELDQLHLSGNSFHGCFPHGMRDVPNNDLNRSDLDWIYDCPNEAPDFAASSYSLTVADDAATGAVVGSVSASDPDGRTVTYAITAGNDDGKFGIDTATGEVSVTGALGDEAGSSYSLTVQASDAEGTTSEVTAVVAVTAAS